MIVSRTNRSNKQTSRVFRRRGHAAGLTFIEMLIAALILSFVIDAGVLLYSVGYTQQLVAQNYSTVQEDLRTALATATRTIRHAYQVVDSNTVYTGFFVTEFSNSQLRYSNANLLCIRAPKSSKGGYVEMSFYLYNGTFYCMRADDTGSPTALETNVGAETIQSVTFNYFQTSGTQRTAVDSEPDLATEVQITLVGQSSTPVTITTTAVTTIYLRNKFAATGP